MNPLLPILRPYAFVLALAAATAPLVLAQQASADSVVGSWLVTIDGETQTRSLVIAEEAQTGDGALLSAQYGISNRGIGAVVARTVGAADRQQLLLTTQANAKIAAMRQPDGSFRGTFTFANGVVKSVAITRTTEEAIKQMLEQGRAAAAKPPSLVQTPGPDVPANCAAFSGAWGGEWPVQGYASLWVATIEANCEAQVVYPAGARAPATTQPRTQAVIKGNTLSLRRPDGGTTSFELSGGSLAATYSGPAGVNRTTMQRIDDPATQARVANTLRATSALVPPASDVPAHCAAFHGHWEGTWSTGGTAPVYLRVVELKWTDGKCMARYSYSPSKNPIPARDEAEIKGRSLSFVCNTTTGGICVFVRSGEALNASYTNLMGGRNNAAFQRQQ